ncbi:MAG: hypothetical protein FWC26_12450 [Fibromonadales bacterium]|nr:hypothetical protein [Fibromonadales bacterium]
MRTIIVLLSIFCALTFAQERPRIAIYIAGAVTEDSDLLFMVINDAFVKNKKYDVVEVSEAGLAVVAGEQGRQRSGSVSLDDIAKMGKDAKAEFVCVIEIKKGKGGSSLLNTRIIEVENKVHKGSEIFTSTFKDNDEIIRVGQQIVALMLGIPASPKKSADAFVDQRDQRKYKIKRIGDYVWFLQDLSYKKDKYTWVEAHTACPNGWRLPNNSEWNFLKADAKPDDLKDFSKASTGYWWSATEYGSNYAYYWLVNSGELKDNVGGKTSADVVRCVQDAY